MLVGRRTDNSHLQKLLVSWVLKTRLALQLFLDDSGARLRCSGRGAADDRLISKDKEVITPTPHHTALLFHALIKSTVVSPPQKINTQTSAASIVTLAFHHFGSNQATRCNLLNGVSVSVRADCGFRRTANRDWMKVAHLSRKRWITFYLFTFSALPPPPCNGSLALNGSWVLLIYS